MHDFSMVREQLAEYILKNLKKGYTLDSLKFSLINQGYTRITVENAIDIANKKLAEEIPVMKEKPQITYKVVEENYENKEETEDNSKNKKGFFSRLFGH